MSFTLHYRSGESGPTRTRSSAHGNLVVPVAVTSVASKSFMIRATIVWNQIPTEIRQSQSVETFKRKLKQWVKINVEVS